MQSYLLRLQILARDCKFDLPASAEANRDEWVCQTFLAGLGSSEMQLRLLEKEKAEFLDIVHRAKLLERAQADAISFGTRRAMKQSLAVVNSGGNDIDAFSNDALSDKSEEKQENITVMRS